jgi:predicted RNase H-like nuclease (RuvC/YqgF family)
MHRGDYLTSAISLQVSRLRKERQQIHDQFSVLYKSKYLPLKQEIGSLQQRASSATEEARSAREEIRMLSKQLESSKMSESALKKALEASQAQVSAAQEEARVACSRLQVVQDKLMVETRQISEQYTSKIHQLEEMMLSKDKELQACRDKLVSLRETCDEIIHQKEVAITGYQRKKLELDVREEEICSLQTRLNEAEKMLDKFANPIGTRSQTLGRAPSPSNIPNTNQNRSLC